MRPHPPPPQYMFAAFRDCVPALRWSRHMEDTSPLLHMLESEVDGYLKDHILQPLCLAVEEDLRLSTHLHLKLDDRNPFKVSLLPCCLHNLTFPFSTLSSHSPSLLSPPSPPSLPPSIGWAKRLKAFHDGQTVSVL